MPALPKLIAIIFIAAYAGISPAKGCFDDEALQNIAQRGGNDSGTLIYVWSPRMVLSVAQAAHAAQAAAQNGLDFVALHDARVLPPELQAALRRARQQHASSAKLLTGGQALCAPQLLERDALRHFPTAFVLTARGTHRFPIVGAMPALYWQRSVAQRLREQP